MKIKWASSVLVQNAKLLSDLEEKMIRFYRSSDSYYENINFTQSAWGRDPNYNKLAKLLLTSARILEVGCGRANILKAFPEFCRRYVGCDFSPELAKANGTLFPEANFVTLTVPNKLPFGSASFDAVFSTFVLEHCVFPARFLSELSRVTAPGGIIVLICPDFLGCSGMPSQRAGLSPGTGREKLRSGKFVDALLTGFDRKIRIPSKAAICRREADAGRGFWINLNPTCFTDPFIADFDAVYLTYQPEIVMLLKMQRFEIIDNLSENKNQIFLVAKKHDTA